MNLEVNGKKIKKHNIYFQVVLHLVMCWICMATAYTFLEGYCDEKYPSMFPETHMQVLASTNWPHVLADTRTTGKCHRCHRRFTVTAVRSAFPWLPRNAMERLCHERMEKTAPDPFSDGLLVGWKSPHRLKKSLVCSKNIGPICLI